MLRYLLVGACLGALGAALVWQFYPGFWKDAPVAPEDIALQHRLVLQEEAQRSAAPAALATMVQPATAASTCDLEPLIPPNGAHDGEASTEHPFPAGPRAKAKVFRRAAEVAAARGRLRDAEVALLAACRWNEEASARPTVPLARVLGLLGDYYLAAAGRDPSSGLREQLVARARLLLTVSAETYASALGPNASRSRQARSRLAAMDQAEAAASQQAAATDPAPQDEGPAAAPLLPHKQPPDRQPVELSRPAGRVAPQADSEFRLLAADLARLRTQAESVSEDPEGFRRRAEAALAQREQCVDAACLREWYAARRRQLLAEF